MAGESRRIEAMEILVIDTRLGLAARVMMSQSLYHSGARPSDVNRRDDHRWCHPLYRGCRGWRPHMPLDSRSAANASAAAQMPICNADTPASCRSKSALNALFLHRWRDAPVANDVRVLSKETLAAMVERYVTLAPTKALAYG